MKFFSHPEGYVEPDGSSFNYIYQYKDHLGNVRLSYSDADGNGSVTSAEILEENNYYPFGLKHKGYNDLINGAQNNHWTFQGQKIDKELGLNWHGFKWRNYDASLSRFHNIDPLAESFGYQSPYNFSENRVIDGVELEGLEYVNANESRVFIKPNGDVSLRMQNMTDGTGIAFRRANADTSTWTSNAMGNQFLNTTIGNVITNIPSKHEGIRGVINQQHKIQPPIAKSIGQPHRGFKNRTVGAGNLVGVKEGRSAKGFLVIEGVKLAGAGIGWLLKQYDKYQINKQIDFLDLAIDNVTDAYNDGLITDKRFYNSESFLDLVNVVLSGDSTSDNKDLEALGIIIYNYYNPPKSNKGNSIFHDTIRRQMEEVEERINNGERY